MNRVLAAGDLSLTDLDQHFGGDVGGGGSFEQMHDCKHTKYVETFYSLIARVSAKYTFK